MGGLMLFGAVGIWMALSVAIGSWLGGFVSAWYWRLVARVALVPLVFFAPVADEIIAWPKMQELCRGTDKYHFATGVNEQSAYGRTVYYRNGYREIRTLVAGPRVRIERGDYLDVTTKQPILSYYTVEPLSSMFAFPDAGGSRNTWILKSCGFSARDSVQIKEARNSFFRERLKLQEIRVP